MIIRDQDNQIELDLVEVDGPPAGDGDGHFHVKVSAHGFSGENYVWVEAFIFHTFVDELQKLANTRSGSAQLESMNPHELRLMVRVLEKTSEIAVEGELRRNVVLQSRRQRVENRLVFALTLDENGISETLRYLRQIKAQFPLP